MLKRITDNNWKNCIQNLQYKHPLKHDRILNVNIKYRILKNK